MRNRCTAVALGALIGLFVVSPLRAGEADDANLEILLSTIRANKKAFVAVNLGLTDSEAKAFWPVYDRYQTELNDVRDRLVEVIEDYSASFTTLTDEKAVDLVDRYLTVEKAHAEVRRRHLKSISTALPGRKVARFYQIENKIDALLRYELASTIRVID